jgi:hypothetical protein
MMPASPEELFDRALGMMDDHQGDPVHLLRPALLAAFTAGRYSPARKPTNPDGGEMTRIIVGEILARAEVIIRQSN